MARVSTQREIHRGTACRAQKCGLVLTTIQQPCLPSTAAAAGARHLAAESPEPAAIRRCRTEHTGNSPADCCNSTRTVPAAAAAESWAGSCSLEQCRRGSHRGLRKGNRRKDRGSRNTDTPATRNSSSSPGPTNSTPSPHTSPRRLRSMDRLHASHRSMDRLRASHRRTDHRRASRRRVDGLHANHQGADRRRASHRRVDHRRASRRAADRRPGLHGEVGVFVVRRPQLTATGWQR